MNRIALTIAGSDPSGGAGIQADLRTFAAFGVEGISVITALTAQSSQGVFGVYPVDPDILSAQLNTILDDTRPSATKIGMFGGIHQVAAVATILQDRKLENIVLDPVLASTGGVPLLDAAGRHLLISEIAAHCRLITPNIDEASLLTGISILDTDSVLKAGAKILSSGANAVLIKGGHSAGPPTDWLFQRHQSPIEFSGPRIDTNHTHGTGCLLSSAIAASLANGLSIIDAISNAKTFVAEALNHPKILGKGRGYPNSLWVHSTALDNKHSEKLALFKGLYVVTDRAVQGGRSHAEVVEAAIDGGAQIIQLRDKTLPAQELVEQAKLLRKLTRERGKLFIINDRVDVALVSDADGVHLGPDDITPADARRILGPDKLIGVSTGTVDEARAAAPFASYFGIGAIYGSTTKTDAGKAVTPQRISEIKDIFPNIPVVAIGGINASNIAQVLASGADAVAVVSAVVAASDITLAAKILADRL